MNKRNGIIIILLLGVIGIITVYFKLNTPEPTNFDPKNMKNLIQIKPGESNKNSGDFITKDEYHKNIDNIPIPIAKGITRQKRAFLLIFSRRATPSGEV